jgi:WD40 repeat protein
VLLAGSDGVERRDLKRNERLWKTDGLFPVGTGLEVSPDGKRVAHVSSAAILIDAETGTELLRRANLLWNCTSARFSPDSKVLAITTDSGTVALLDAATGETLPQSADLLGSVAGLTFSTDGRTLSAVSGDRWVRWDLTAAAPRAEVLASFVSLSPDGRVGIRPDTFNRADADAEFVDPVTGKRIAKLDPPETGATVIISRADRGGQFSGDGKRFIGFRRSARGPGGQQTELGVAVWDTSSGKRIVQQAPENAPSWFPAVSPDGKAVAIQTVLDRKAVIGVRSLDTDKLLWTHKLGTGQVFTGQVFATFADGGAKLVVQEFYPARVPIGPPLPDPPGPSPFVIFDAATGKELARANGPDLGKQPLVFTRDAAYPAPNAKAISPDGKTLAVSGWDGTIYLWDIATDRQKAKLAHPGPVHELAFSPAGKVLAAASFAAPVMVYAVPTDGTKP